ncbi:MAG: pilus assembly protein PilM [Myxococcota bacterium]
MSWPPRWLRRPAHGAEYGPIGLEVTPHEVRVAQVHGEQRKGLHVGGVFERRSDAELADPSELKGLLREAGCRGRRVVTVLPEERTRLLVLNFEPEEATDESETVLNLIDERVEESIENYVVDYLTLRAATENQAERSVLAAVAPKRVALRHLENLHASGLDVEALEIPPLALHRLLSETGFLGERETVVAIRVLPTRSDLLVQSGRRLVLFRTIDLGEDAFLAALSKGLEVDRRTASEILDRFGFGGANASQNLVQAPGSDAEVARAVAEILTPLGEALVEDIQRAGVYVASQCRGAGLDRVLLLGRPASWPGLAAWVGELLSVRTEVLEPTSAIPGGIAEPQGDLSVALGLALRGSAA